jgi:membrane protein required for colicin V production
MLGALFGLARGVLLLLALVMLAGLTPLPRQSWWRQALFAPPLETAVVALKPWLPAALAQRLQYR